MFSNEVDTGMVLSNEELAVRVIFSSEELEILDRGCAFFGGWGAAMWEVIDGGSG